MGKKLKSVKKQEVPHVYIATPAYDGKVDTDFAQSLAEAAQAATVFGIRITAAVMGNGAFIDLARNTFVRIFLEEHRDCTHLFFIDSDLKFESRAFVELVRYCTKDNPVTAGAYRRRQEPEDFPIMWTPEPELSKDGIDKLWVKEDGWLQCMRVATGFLCIHRTVVEKMAKKAVKINIKGQAPIPRLFYTYLDDENRFVGEDFAWCDDYRKQFDCEIPVWMDFDFRHAGYECNYMKHLSKKVEDFDKYHKNKKTKLGDRRKAG